MLRTLAHAVAQACTLIAVAILAVAAAAAAVQLVAGWRRHGDIAFIKMVWLRFAGGIILALEFALAADIADTAVAPSWTDTGQLAAIAAIRTFLNLFLERDLEPRLQFRKPPVGENKPAP